MSEKKKQASIAAFFSPQAKSAAVPTVTAKKAASSPASISTVAPKQTAPAPSSDANNSSATSAAKKRTKRGDGGASTPSSAKRPRATSSPRTGASKQPTKRSQTLSPPATADAEASTSQDSGAPSTPIVVDGTDDEPSASSDAAPSQQSQSTTTAVLLTPLSPSKSAKPRSPVAQSASEPDTAAVVAVKDQAPVPLDEPQLQPVEAVAAPQTAVATDSADSDDEFLSGDEDTSGGPHALGPHAVAPVGGKRAATTRGRKQTKAAKTKSSSPATAVAPTPDATATPPSSTTTAVATGKSKASQAKAAATPAATSAAAKTPSKRVSARAASKDKAASAATAAASAMPATTAETKTTAAPPAPAPAAAVVLDPLVKARVDTYQQKIEALTTQCAAFLETPQATDAILQDIYGVAVDLGLDVAASSSEALATAATELFTQLSAAMASSAVATAASDAVTEFSLDLKRFVAQRIQGQSAGLSSLSHSLLLALVDLVDASERDAPVAINASVRARVLVMLEMEIKMLAQRTNYGVRPPKANVFEDTSADALWIWEIGNVDKYFSDDALKTIKRVRKHRKRLGLQLKTLARVVQLLHQSPVDEVKVSLEEAKVGKFVLAVESETQKAQDRERKELEKVQHAEHKKQQELEREQAKLEEKRKREEDEEAERALASKRKKSLVSYFRSIDKSASSGASASGASASDATVAGASASADDSVDASSSHAERRKTRRESAQHATMARMDAAVAFLVGDGSRNDDAAVVPSAWDGAAKSMQDIRAHVLGGKERVTASSGHWSSRRRRDAALGVMKLLQFHENYRPAYYGTFSTKSKVFRGGRRPFAQYKKFDYSVDSEEEWEEEEPGESLSDADSDVDESDDDLDYGDQWLAYEDEVDYMDGADDETKEDGDAARYLSSPERKKKLPAQLEQKKKARVPGRKKATKPAKLEPQIVGPFGDGDDEAAATLLSAYTGELLCAPQFESTLMRKAREHDETRARQQREQEEKLRQQAAELAAGKASGAASNAPLLKTPVKTLLKTPVKTSQKRKMSAETTGLTSPQPTGASSSSTQTLVQQPVVKAGITAWLKKPAIVDLSSTSATATASSSTSASKSAVVDLSTNESDA